MRALEKQFDATVEQWADQTVDELKGQGKSMADRAIQSVADRVQDDYINKIKDREFRAAATSTLNKLSTSDGLMTAFDATKSSGLC